MNKTKFLPDYAKLKLSTFDSQNSFFPCNFETVNMLRVMWYSQFYLELHFLSLFRQFHQHLAFMSKNCCCFSITNHEKVTRKYLLDTQTRQISYNNHSFVCSPAMNPYKHIRHIYKQSVLFYTELV